MQSHAGVGCSSTGRLFHQPAVALERSPDLLLALVAEMTSGASVAEVSEALADALHLAFPIATSIR